MPPAGLPQDRYEAGLNIVADKKSGCAQCHYLGDYKPGEDPFAAGPDLTKVYQRLRPDYVRRWVAKPDQILPYTGMPPIIKFAAPPEDYPAQDIFPGT